MFKQKTRFENFQKGENDNGQKFELSIMLIYFFDIKLLKFQ